MYKQHLFDRQINHPIEGKRKKYHSYSSAGEKEKRPRIETDSEDEAELTPPASAHVKGLCCFNLFP